MARKSPGAKAEVTPKTPDLSIDEPASEDVDGGGDMALLLAGLAAKELKQAGVFKNLFGPPSKVIGENWAKNLESHYARKRETNTQQHYERVKQVAKISPPVGGPTERQAEAVLDWVEDAQKVDPENEPELAAFWQSLLADIYNNDPITDDIRPILKTMSRGDARVLLGLQPHSRQMHVESPYLERFSGWGIISKARSQAVLWRSSMLGVASLTIGLLSQSLPLNLGNYTDGLLPAMGLLIGGTGIFASITLAINIINSYQLTRLGERIVLDARKYAKTPVEPEPNVEIGPQAETAEVSEKKPRAPRKKTGR